MSKNQPPAMEEYDFVQERQKSGMKLNGIVGSVAHIVKGGLGAGILGGHVAYMKAGVYPATVLTILTGIFITYCMFILGQSAHILYKRQKKYVLTYPDLSELAFATSSSPRVAKLSKCFRYYVDTIICVDLFGACATYQVIIAKTVKQLVEHQQIPTIEGIPGYPGIRVYLVALLPLVIFICLITQLKYLSPFSIIGNAIIVVCIGMACYYAFANNPTFSNLKPYTNLYNTLEYIGISMFGMSCVGVALPIENHLKDPKKYRLVIATGMSCITMSVYMMSFFGYVGYLDQSTAPITVNFPLTTFPSVLKGLIIVMMVTTHALNFWVPFNICFHYIRPRVKNPNKVFMVELLCRTAIVILIGVVAIAFPYISALMGLIGAFCLSNMAFLWPCIIYLVVIWNEPGLGKYKWRLIRFIITFGIGLFVFIFGTCVGAAELYHHVVEELTK